MKFDVFLFDLDGTLLNLGDIGPYADMLLEETLINLKTPNIPDKHERRQFWGSGDNYIEILNKWEVPQANKFWEYFDKVDFKHRKIMYSQNKISLFEEVEEVLKKIYNHKEDKKIAIVSNTADYVVDFIIKQFNISSYFHEIFSMGSKNDEKLAKPSPSGILSILKKFEYDQNIHRALMIGDSISDIIAAKKANISACLINRSKFRSTKEISKWKFQPDYIIERLDEILKL
ncbi:MAG: HAD family hydrolase [Promethearchaeota archaeon]